MTTPSEFYKTFIIPIYSLPKEEWVPKLKNYYKTLWDLNNRDIYYLVNTIESEILVLGGSVTGSSGQPLPIPENFEYEDVEKLQKKMITGKKLLQLTKQFLVSFTNMPNIAKANEYIVETISGDNPEKFVSKLRGELFNLDSNLKYCVTRYILNICNKDISKNIEKILGDQRWIGNDYCNYAIGEFEDEL